MASLPVGYFGASTGAGAALCAAAELGEEVGAVVSRGGRPDLAAGRLPEVRAPVLLIVGGDDQIVLELNREAQRTAPSTLGAGGGARRHPPVRGARSARRGIAVGWRLVRAAPSSGGRAGDVTATTGPSRCSPGPNSARQADADARGQQRPRAGGVVAVLGEDHRARRACGVLGRRRRGSAQLVEPGGRGGGSALLRHRTERPTRAFRAGAGGAGRRGDRLVGTRGRSGRRDRGARRAPGRAGRAGPYPARDVRHPGVAQRRAGRASADLGVLHPEGRGLDPRAARLEHPRGADLSAGGWRRDQSLAGPLLPRGGVARRPGQRAGVVYARD